MMILKRIGILSVGYTLAVLYAIFGFFQGLIVAIDPTSLASVEVGLVKILANLSFWIFLILPILGLLIGLIAGFFGGVIIAFLYNLVARFTGGIKMDFVETKKKK